jgi:(1->4)-alpha-D-glucan 1-alpha-D-glucosylmutase
VVLRNENARKNGPLWRFRSRTISYRADSWDTFPEGEFRSETRYRIQDIRVSNIPRATLRLQLHKDFDFQDALAQVDYFSALGISHLYLSPIHTARPGSTHGYDVVDYSSVNPELGGEEGLRRLVSALREREMGVIVDLVPNHMAIGGHENKVWLDLLEWGMQSRHAHFFDIDWDVPDPALHHRVHAPFLGKPYGETLADGELKLHFDKTSGRIYLGYFDNHFPIAPKDYARILRSEALPVAEEFRGISSLRNKSEHKFELARESLRAAAEDPQVALTIENCLNEFHPGTDAGRGRLHQLLERQHYRLAWWQTAADEINWRRFFDVIELAGLRVQDLTTFEIVHANTFRLYQEGLIDGVRVDHVDGIADPRTYCRRLRRALTKLNHLRPADAPKGVPYIFVEKILAPGEQLSKEWQVDGDTGYSFMNDVGALLHHPAGEQPLMSAWTHLTGRPGDFEVEEKRARRRTVQTMLAADFNGCAHALHKIARSHPTTRDFSLLAIRRVLTEILVEFPVYRTYVDARGRSDADSAIMRETLEAARKRCQPSDRPLIDKIDLWLGGEAPLNVKPASARQARLQAIARFQQLSSPVAAKSVEDTAFYRHGPLLSRNEVGSTPSQFYLTSEEFHSRYRRRLQRYPQAMLCTATHDHKRGEDVRARLAVLSEIPDDWLNQVEAWREENEPLKSSGHKAGPDAADEYMLYQMLVGAWPLNGSGREDVELFCERVAQWQEKAVREAKRNSNWIEPNTEYERQCENFLRTLLSSERFVGQLRQFVRKIAPASAINSLTQLLIKMSAPGIPDFYQGCDLWDFSFVDPDNRRPVDYEQRHSALASDADLKTLIDDWHNGHIKQRLIVRGLATRKILPQVFSHGRYLPLKIEGPMRNHLFCFAREFDDRVAIAATVRFAATLADDFKPFVPRDLWQGTHVVLPKRWHTKLWRNALDGRDGWDGMNGPQNRLEASWLFETLPVVLLIA